VTAGPYLDAELTDSISDLLGAADRTRGTVEGGQQTVAERLDVSAAVAIDLGPGALIMRSE
jgi:hypothetical protein